jgi:hypothetical protein
MIAAIRRWLSGQTRVEGVEAFTSRGVGIVFFLTWPEAARFAKRYGLSPLSAHLRPSTRDLSVPAEATLREFRSRWGAK